MKVVARFRCTYTGLKLFLATGKGEMERENHTWANIFFCQKSSFFDSRAFFKHAKLFGGATSSLQSFLSNFLIRLGQFPRQLVSYAAPACVVSVQAICRVSPRRRRRRADRAPRKLPPPNMLLSASWRTPRVPACFIHM